MTVYYVSHSNVETISMMVDLLLLLGRLHITKAVQTHQAGYLCTSVTGTYREQPNESNAGTERNQSSLLVILMLSITVGDTLVIIRIHGMALKRNGIPFQGTEIWVWFKDIFYSEKYKVDGGWMCVFLNQSDLFL